MLMKRMGKSSSAVGFAVYLDRLDGLFTEKEENRFDVCILYDEKTDPSDVCKLIRKTVADGKTYTARREADGVICDTLIDLR